MMTLTILVNHRFNDTCNELVQSNKNNKNITALDKHFKYAKTHDMTLCSCILTLLKCTLVVHNYLLLFSPALYISARLCFVDPVIVGESV